MSATHRAGLKTKIWYESQEEIIRSLHSQSVSPQEKAVERQMTPLGGQIVIQKEEPGLGQDVGPKLGNEFTTVDQIKIFQDGSLVHACEVLEREYPKRSFVSKVFSGSVYFEKCSVPRKLEGAFDALLLTFDGKAIGKYSFHPKD